MTEQIFISYRRDDSFHPAESICTALQARLGIDAVFMDKTIEPGNDWPDEIRTALENSQTVLVVVVDWDKRQLIDSFVSGLRSGARNCPEIVSRFVRWTCLSVATVSTDKDVGRTKVISGQFLTGAFEQISAVTG